MDLIKFRRELESALGIVAWNPQDQQLKNIVLDIQRIRSTGEDVDLELLREIVHKHAEIGSSLIMEGVDTSDIKTLLLLATKPK